MPTPCSPLADGAGVPSQEPDRCSKDTLVLTVPEVAALLRVNVKTVYAAIAAGELPGKKVGRRTIVPRAALLDWLRSNERVPPSRGRRA